MECNSKGSISDGVFCKLDKHVFNKVKASKQVNCCDYMQEIIEDKGYICYTPTKGYCFMQFNIQLTG